MQSPKTNPAQTSKFCLQSTPHSLETVPSNSFLVHATNGFGVWGAGVALAIHDLFPNADKVYAAHCDSFRSSKDAWPRKQGLVGGVCVVPPQVGDHAASTRKAAGDAENSVDGNDKIDGAVAQRKKDKSGGELEGIWITCLFTSYGFGRPTKKHAGLDRKGEIRAQTRSALVEFRRVVESIEAGDYKIDEISDIRKFVVSAADGAEGSKSRVTVGEKRKRDAIDEQDKQTHPIAADGGSTEERLKKHDWSNAMNMDIYSPQFNSGKFGMPWEETRKVVEEVFSDWKGNWYVLSPPT